MEFIKLNYRQIAVVFFLCSAVFGLLILIAYLSPANNIVTPTNINEAKVWVQLTSAASAAALFLVYLLGGMYNFYRGRKLLLVVASLDILDKGLSTRDYRKRNSLIFYDGEQLSGTILGYPTKVFIMQQVSDYVAPLVVFSICIYKFNQPHIERISFSLKSLKNAQQLERCVIEFCSSLKSKGYVKCEFTLVEKWREMC